MVCKIVPALAAVMLSDRLLTCVLHDHNNLLQAETKSLLQMLFVPKLSEQLAQKP